MNGKEMISESIKKGTKFRFNMNLEKLASAVDLILETDRKVTLTAEEVEETKHLKNYSERLLYLQYGFYNKEKENFTFVDSNVIKKVYSANPPKEALKKLGYTIVDTKVYLSAKKIKENPIYKLVEQEEKREEKKNSIRDGHRGVYGIYIDNELVYVGMTNRDFKIRWNEHKECVKNPEIRNSQQNYLYKAMRENKFEFKVLCEAKPFNTEKDIKCMEYALITFNKPKYNYCGVVVDYNWN